MTYTFSTTSDGNVQVSQNGSVVSTTTPQNAATSYGYVEPTANAPKPVTSEVGVVSSAQGADTIANKTKQLSSLTPVPVTTTPTTETKTPTTDTPAPATKITLLNPTTGQQSIFEDADLNKQNIQTLMSSGYKVSETSGTLPSWLTASTTGTTETPQSKLQGEIDTAAADLKQKTADLSKFTISDADLKLQTDAITAQWDARIADMQKINSAREGNIRTTGYRLGMQFAGGSGGVFGGIISEEERQGVARIGELEGNKQSAIAAARSAAQQQNWQVFSKQVDLAQKAYEDKVTALKELNTATTAQNKLIADNLKDQQKKYYDEVQKPVNDILTKYTENGGNDPAVMSAIQSSKSLGEALTAAGDYIQSGTGEAGDYLFAKRQALSKGLTAPDYDTWKQKVDDQKLASKIAEMKATEGVRFNYSIALEKAKQAIANEPNPDYNGEFESTIKLASASGTTKDQRNQIQRNLQDFISAGDYGSAYTEITNAVTNRLKGTSGQDFANHLIAQESLQDLKTNIEAYMKIPGASMNIFKGKEDDIQNKLGALATDPKYASIAVQLSSAFFQYRKNMTGAAFTPAESASYASVLPGKGNTLDLNLAKIEGANSYLNSQINGAIKTTVGQGGIYIREKAQAASSMIQDQTTAKQKVNSYITSHPDQAEKIATMAETASPAFGGKMPTDEQIAEYLNL